MKTLKTFLSVAVILGVTGTTLAWPIDPWYEDGPQDPLFLEQDQWHELGNLPLFPQDEWITSVHTYTDQTSCFDGHDDPNIPNILVEITNMTQMHWWDLHYVADPETTITNFDGWIGNAGMSDLEEAFRIDYRRTGTINGPLVFESIAANEIFEVGETWLFIIQDFGNTLGGSPSDFSSLGIAGMSGGLPSTGSIIARQWIPSPGVLSLLAVAGFIGNRRRR